MLHHCSKGCTQTSPSALQISCVWLSRKVAVNNNCVTENQRLWMAFLVKPILEQWINGKLTVTKNTCHLVQTVSRCNEYEMIWCTDLNNSTWNIEIGMIKWCSNWVFFALCSWLLLAQQCCLHMLFTVRLTWSGQLNWAVPRWYQSCRQTQADNIFNSAGRAAKANTTGPLCTSPFALFLHHFFRQHKGQRVTWDLA